MSISPAYVLVLAERVSERDQGPSCYRAALSLIPFVSHTRTGSRSVVTNAIPYPKKWWCLNALVLGFAKKWSNHNDMSQKTSLSLATSHIIIMVLIRVPSHNRCQRDVCFLLKRKEPFHVVLVVKKVITLHLPRARSVFVGCDFCYAARIIAKDVGNVHGSLILLSIVVVFRPHSNA